MNVMECKFVDIKALDDAERKFGGYGAVFGNVDYYGDMIQPGAFTDSLAKSKNENQFPSMLFQHGFTSDFDIPVGIWTDMREDSIGLYVEGGLAGTTLGNDAYTLLKMEPRPAIDGLSIGFIPVEWANRSKPEEPRRTLKKIDLIEISLVTFPANPKARINSVKSDVRIRNAERALRDAGFSRQEAKAILAEGYNALTLCDADNVADEELVEILRRNVKILNTRG